MATSKTTAKKAATRKPAAKPAAARKAPVKTVKAAPAKATATKKAAPRKATKKAAPMQSFRVYRDDEAFTAFRITRQTFYWVVLVAFIVFAQLWILKLQVEVSTLLQQQESALINE